MKKNTQKAKMSGNKVQKTKMKKIEGQKAKMKGNEGPKAKIKRLCRTVPPYRGSRLVWGMGSKHKQILKLRPSTEKEIPKIA